VGAWDDGGERVMKVMEVIWSFKPQATNDIRKLPPKGRPNKGRTD